MTIRSIAAAALIAVAAPALAVEPVPGALLGTDPAAIAAALQDSGWTIREIEREKGRIEVKAQRDGRRLEVYVDAATGAVSKIEEKH